jgi:hypothetical protein
MNLTKFKSDIPVTNYGTLDDGRHNFTIEVVKVLESDRIKNLEGERKTQAELDEAGVDYTDEHEQLLLGIRAENGQLAFHRFNIVGFVKFDELSDTTGYFRSSHPAGYAVDVETKRRLISPVKEKAALNILNSMFASCEREKEPGVWEALPVKGAKINDLPGCRFSAVVKNRTYMNRQAPPDIGSFNKWGYTGSTSILNGKVEVIKAKAVDDNF